LSIYSRQVDAFDDAAAAIELLLATQVFSLLRIASQNTNRKVRAGA
jgi:hypothetical protein